MKLSSTHKAVVTAAACLAIGATAGIVGSAAAPSHSSSSKRSPAARAHRFGEHGFFGHRGMGGPGMHGPPVHETAVVLNKAGDGFITVTEDSGAVKSVSGSDVTITEGFGKVTYKDQTVTIPAGAAIYRDGAKATAGALAAGDFIHVTSSSEGTFVMAIDKAHLHSMEGPGFGPGRRHFGPGDGHGMGPGGPPPAAM